MIAPSASCIIPGAKSMTTEPTGSLSALSGDGFAITTIPPIIIKIPAITVSYTHLTLPTTPYV